MKKLYLMPLLFLTACSTTKPPMLVLQPEPPPPATDNLALRYPEVIRAYHIGRYVDPNDGLLMHGRQVVYRVEQNARWNLHPGSAGGRVPTAAPTQDSAFWPAPVNDAVLAEVNEQTLATAQIEMEAKNLSTALARFEAALQQTKTNWQELAALRVQFSDLQMQINALTAAQRKEAALPPPASTNRSPDEFFDTDDTNSPKFNP